MLLRSFEPPNLPFPASMLSIRIASMPCTCSFEGSNHPIFHSRPVCYLYVLPVCHVHATSKLRTTQSSIPGQYAIYTYCQYAIYMLLPSCEPPNLPFPASMLSIRTASMPFTCYFQAANHPIFHSRPVCYLYVLPVCYLHATSKLRTSQSSIPGQHAIYTYCQYAMYMLLRSFEPPNLPFPASMLSIRTASMQCTCYFEASNHQIFHSRPVYAIYTYCQYAMYMLLRSFEPPNLPFPASMLSIRTASMPCTCYFEASNHPIFHSRPVCYLYVLPVCHLHATSKPRTSQSSIPGQHAIYTYCQYAMYMLLRSFEPPNLPFPASMLSIRTASMPCTCSFEASNHPTFHSRPVCYLYVLPVCHVHATSKLRTTQSSIPGQYAIYTYCQYAMYMLLRSFEPPNLPFPASMLSIRTASMPCTCSFEASNDPTFHSRPVCYLYVLPVRSFEPPNLPFPASMLSIRTASMPFTCYFEASNLPIFHSRPVCYLYVMPVCHVHATSKLRTTQSSIPSQYAIYTYCQYAIYMLLRSFEPPNLPFPASMLSIRTASMPCTCYFEASNHPIFHSRPVCYLYVLPVCHVHATSKLRTTQSSIPGQYAIYTYCQYAMYMLLRSFERPNLPFPASMLSIRTASMPFTCYFGASNHPIFHSRPVCYLYVLPVCHLHATSNHPIFHSRPVCYLYVLPVCYLHATSKLRTSQSSIPGQHAIYTYCQYAMYMLLRSFEPPNLPFPASMLSIRTASMPCTCYFEASNHQIFHSRPVYAIYTYCQYAMYMLLRSLEPPNLPFPASMLSIRTASMPCTCYFEASNHPIFHSRPVCYLYVMPVCHLHATSKLRTTQSSIPGLYAIYTYCQYAIYMPLRSFEPPNLPFPASMLSIRTASMPCTCYFEASNHPIFHSRPVCYLYVLPVCNVHAPSKLRTTQSSIPGQYAIYTYCQYTIYMLLRSFEPPNLPFPASICYLYVLPVCHVHATSKLRTTQSFIPSQYAIYTDCHIYMLLRCQYTIDTYCHYAIYTQNLCMLLRNFEPPTHPFLASMLSIRTASMPCTCCFGASNHPLIHS